MRTEGALRPRARERKRTRWEGPRAQNLRRRKLERIRKMLEYYDTGECTASILIDYVRWVLVIEELSDAEVRAAAEVTQRLLHGKLPERQRALPRSWPLSRGARVP